ncbi:MAG: hypothetical protein GY771_10795 [bacterium]|nr:hypothetical protein [bacterium]
MTRYILLAISTIAVLLGCSEDGSQFPLISKRGDDGREFLYRWPDSDTMENWIFDCTVSPNAAEVAFLVKLDNGYYGYDIAVLNLKSGICRLIREGEAWRPVWSKSGEWIAFASTDGPGTFENIWLLRPDGSETRPAVLESLWSAVPNQWFNLDHNKLLFGAHIMEEPDGVFLCIYELDTGDYYRITTPDYYWSSIGGISPDDEWIAKSQILSYWDDVPNIPLCYIRPDGRDYFVEIRARRAQIHGGVIDWSPDGKYLLFFIQASATSEYFDVELWTYELGTGVFRQLTMAPEGYEHPSGNLSNESIYHGDWASDGYVYFSSDGKLWRIKGPV